MDVCVQRSTARTTGARDAAGGGLRDGRRLYLGADGIAKLSRFPDGVGSVAFLLIHESVHAMLRHSLRAAGWSNREVANIALDYLVNGIIDDLNKEAVGIVPFPILDGAYLDRDLSDGHTGLSLYNHLLSDSGDSDSAEENGDSAQAELYR